MDLTVPVFTCEQLDKMLVGVKLHVDQEDRNYRSNYASCIRSETNCFSEFVSRFSCVLTTITLKSQKAKLRDLPFDGDPTFHDLTILFSISSMHSPLKNGWIAEENEGKYLVSSK